MGRHCNKANTVEQFKILQFLEKQFDLEAFEVMLLSRNEIAITDRVGESMVFKYVNGKVTWEE
ncbi:MAG: hypothetical protein N3E37_05680 [Candidatus Micrarchaeota archaeon]|nr:hypothetical protein [Candidatus Micrarchaeota archaeon]